jgi:predicted transposase YbfD/YdcC
MQSSTAQAVDAEGVVFTVASLTTWLAGLGDARRARGKRYPLPQVLLLLVLAKLSGEDRPSGIAEWVALRRESLQAALGLAWPRMPHHNTYRRVLAAAVDAEALAATVGAFFRALPGTGQSVLISIDGKTLRGTIDWPATRGEHLLAAYLPAEGVVLLQVAAGGKENEISVAPTLLRALDLRGKVVIGDALHTQRALSAQIVAAEGDYVWFVKDNQPTLRAEIAELFRADDRTVAGGHLPPELRVARSVDKGHGRQDMRTLWASSDLRGYSDWPGLQQVFRLERERHHRKRDKREREVVYGVTSLAPNEAAAARLLALSRGYWGIENGLHYRRDVTFHEDATRLTCGQAGRVMAALNNLVIGLLCRAGYTNHAAARRQCSANLALAVALLSPGQRT